MELATLIRQKCAEKNLTVSRLEKMLGFSNGYIATIQEPIVNFERAKAISEAIDIPLYLIAKGIPEPPPDDAQEKPAERQETANFGELCDPDTADDIKMLLSLNSVGRAELRGEMRQMLRLKKYNDLLP